MTSHEKYIELLEEISHRANASKDVNSNFFSSLEKLSPLIKDEIEYVLRNRGEASRSHIVTLLRTSFEKISGLDTTKVTESDLQLYFEDKDFMQNYKNAILNDNSSNADTRRAISLKVILSLVGYKEDSYTLMDFGAGSKINLMELAALRDVKIDSDIVGLDVNHHISKNILPGKIYAVEKNESRQKNLKNQSYSQLVQVLDSHMELQENLVGEIDVIIASSSLYQLSKVYREKLVRDLQSILSREGWLIINDVFSEKAPFLWASDWGNSSRALYATYAITKKEPRPLEIFRWSNSHCEKVSAGKDLDYFINTYSTISGNTSTKS